MASVLRSGGDVASFGVELWSMADDVSSIVEEERGGHGGGGGRRDEVGRERRLRDEGREGGRAKAEKILLQLWECANCKFRNWDTRAHCRACLRARTTKAKLVGEVWKKDAVPKEVLGPKENATVDLGSGGVGGVVRTPGLQPAIGWKFQPCG